MGRIKKIALFFATFAAAFAMANATVTAAPNGVYLGANQNGTAYDAIFVMALVENSQSMVRVIFFTNPAKGYPGKPNVFADGVVPVQITTGGLKFSSVPDKTRCMGSFDIFISAEAVPTVKVTGKGQNCTVDFKGKMKLIPMN